MLKIFILLIIFLKLLFAHPHSFIDVYPSIKLEKNNKIKFMTIKWYMDEMTSSMLMMEFDQNGNGKLDKNEISYIKDNYFDSLKDYGFYTYIKDNGKNISYKLVNFSASIYNKTKISYKFTIKLNKEIMKRNFQTYFYDSDFFTAFTVKKGFVDKNTKKNFIVKDYDGDFCYGYILQGKK